MAVVLADPNGISLFADAGTLFGPKLKGARLRVDNTPSFTGTWWSTPAATRRSTSQTVRPGLSPAACSSPGPPCSTTRALANPLTPASTLTADYATFNDAGERRGT